MPFRRRLLRLFAFLVVQLVVFVVWLTVNPPHVAIYEQEIEGQPVGLPRLTISVRECLYDDSDVGFAVRSRGSSMAHVMYTF